MPLLTLFLAIKSDPTGAEPEPQEAEPLEPQPFGSTCRRMGGERLCDPTADCGLLPSSFFF
jgi:hypothetical protein